VAAVDGSGRAKTVQAQGTIGLTTEPRGHGEATEGTIAEGQTGRSDPAASHPIASPLHGAAASSPAAPAAPSASAQPVTRTMAGYAFRGAVGPRRLKSTRFTVTQVSPTLFRVTGSGYGHGVGLCQIGARGMALPPYRCTFRQILAHYYRGVTVAAFHPTGDAP